MSVFQGAGQQHAGSFSADMLRITFGTADGGTSAVAGHIVQSVQFNFTQQISLMFEMGTNNAYYIRGRAQGSAQLARVTGPASTAAAFVKYYSDVCNPQDITFSSSAGCTTTTGTRTQNAQALTYNLKDTVISTLSAAVSAQDVVVNESLQMIYIDLDSGAE